MHSSEVTHPGVSPKADLRYFFDNLSFLFRSPTPFPPAVPILLLRFSRSVYHAAHNSHFDIQRNILYHIFYFVGKTDQIDLRSSAGRTGYHFDAAVSESQCLQDPFGGFDFFERISGQGYTDRIADALIENDAESYGRLVFPENNVPASVIPTWSG